MTRLPDAGTTTADYAALAAAKDKLNDLAAQFLNTVPQVGRHYDEAVAGAGEFRGELEMGAVKFLIAWREALTVCSESAGLIAGNIGGYALDLSAVDVDLQVTVGI